MRRLLPICTLMLAVTGWADRAAAQARPDPVVEAGVGYAGFVDERWDGRAMLSGAFRVYVTRRLAVGPDFAFLRGPVGEYDWTLGAAATLDLLDDDTAGGRRRLLPYVVLGAGYVRQVRQVGRGPGTVGRMSFESGEGTVSGGLGVRIAIGRRFVLSPEARIGWEPEIRLGLTIGARPGR